MKNSLVKIWLIAAVIAFSLTGCDGEKIVSVSELPNEITTYISTHFPYSTILQGVVERDGFSKTYQITLSDATKLEFNRKKEIVDIDGKNALPNSVIPEKILQYVCTNFPHNSVTDWKLDDRKQQVELDNEITLEFNKDGDFLRIDD